MAKGMRIIMVVLSSIAVMLVQGVTSKSLTVGDSSGWVVPTSPDSYSSWAGKQNFAVGDILVFNFTTRAHTVAQITSEDAYEKCDAKLDPKAKTYTSTTEVTLTEEGTYYFICTIDTHCKDGQKLTITVPSMGTTTPETPPTPVSPPPRSSALRVSGFPVSFMTLIMSLLVLARVII